MVSLELGTVDPLTPELFAGGERWLGIQVGGDPEMLPRHPVSSVPYSLVAATAGALDCTGCVDSSELANGSVTTAKLRGGAVTGVKLAAGSVTTNKIATNAITNAQLAANSVESTKIVDRSVTAADLANNAVNSSKIANDSVQAQDVAFNYAGSSTKGGKATDSDLVDGLDSTALALVEHDHCWVELGIFTLVESFGIGSSCVSVKTVDAPGGDPGPLGEGPAHNFVGDASMALGTDGLPIISYTSGRQDGLDFVDEEIRVAHCNDLECSSATITVIDSAGEVGTFSSIAIGADGFPIISYYDDTNENLKVAHCNNVACTSALAFTAVDDPGNVGRLSSMGIGGDGFPVISYYDETNKTIRLLHCLNVPCTGGSSRRIDSSEPFFGFGSLAVGSDGLPIIMYQSVPPGEFDPVPIKVAHCNDATCTDPTINVVGGHGFLGSMVIGADGLPLLSYTESSHLKVVHCEDVACTTFGTTALVSDPGTFASDNSIAIGPDGLPMIAYNSSDGTALAHCRDVACTGARLVTLDYSDASGYSAQVSGSGELIVSLSSFSPDLSTGKLDVLQCHCTPPDDS